MTTEQLSKIDEAFALIVENSSDISGKSYEVALTLCLKTLSELLTILDPLRSKGEPSESAATQPEPTDEELLAFANDDLVRLVKSGGLRGLEVYAETIERYRALYRAGVASQAARVAELGRSLESWRTEANDAAQALASKVDADLVRGVPATARRLGWWRCTYLMASGAYLVHLALALLSAGRPYALAHVVNPLVIGWFFGSWFVQIRVERRADRIIKHLRLLNRQVAAGRIAP